ncbi:MFS transporter [Streptacidiphilus neutrinimicus]|uniref:MFS transporter n=1 Tax=Streptacidiphilus neutrinimicus TaxID=105420 RepID=UPI0005A72940|nr:MFS transporter [Streptacidiphilus neutrinimicus]
MATSGERGGTPAERRAKGGAAGAGDGRGGEAAAAPDGGRPLHRTGDYLLLWWGQSTSSAGDAVSSVALPLLAIETLHVDALQNGVLRAAEQVAALFALPLGIVVDRMRRRRLMIGTDVARLLVTLLVAAVALLGQLTYLLVIAVALAMGLLDSLFAIAYQSHLPDLLEERHRVAGTAQLGTGKFGALTAGYALGGVLVAAVGAARALVVDAGSFLVSAVTLLAVRRPDPRHGPRGAEGGEWTDSTGQAGKASGVRAELALGVDLLRENRRLAVLAWATTGISFAFSLSVAVEMLFLVQDLHASAFGVGVVYAAPVAAGVPGSWLSVRLMRRHGPERVMRGAIVLYAPAVAAPAFAPSGSAGLVVAGAAWTVLILVSSAYNACNNVLRQDLTAAAVRGRVNALLRAMAASAKLVALLVGGALGVVLGLRGALVAAAVAALAPTFLLLATGAERSGPLRGTACLRIRGGRE